MGDKSPWVRQRVVTAYRLSPETLDPLAGDKSRQVRLALKERTRHAPFLAKLAALKERSRQNRATPPPTFSTRYGSLKLLRLAARNITNKRGGNLGTGTRGWKRALNQLEIHFPNRLNLTR